jgi:glycosyltransferase involved in cell wall biosynthesis
MKAFVSILMLTHNAPEYVETSIRTVRENTVGIDFELVVVDNASDPDTVALVSRLHSEGLITTLKLSDHNALFAAGNNIAADLAEPRATHFLLLNSDIEVRSPDWLRHLLDIHERGICAYGWVPYAPEKVDGYCLLVDADLYRRHRLDESHQWWWAVTKMQAILLNEGFVVKGYDEHERYIHHFGGKSGDGYKNARGMDVTEDEVARWFAGRFPRNLGSASRPARLGILRRAMQALIPLRALPLR